MGQTKTYDMPLTVSHNLGSHDFGAGGDALAIGRPPGVQFARVSLLGLAATETFTNDTTPAYVRVGTASDADKFAEFDLGTTADTDGLTTNVGVTAAGNFIDLDRDGDSGASLDQLEVAFVAPTGGTPAGIGSVTLVVDWW